MVNPRQVGYSVERDCVLHYKGKGIFALKIHQDQQKGELRSIDVIVIEKGKFVQCKRRKKYLLEPEKNRIRAIRDTYKNMKAELCYRDNGLHFEPIK